MSTSTRSFAQKFFAWLMVVSVILSSLGSFGVEPVQAQEVGIVTPNTSAEIDINAVLEKLIVFYDLNPESGAFIQPMSNVGLTLFGLFIVPSSENSGPTMHYFVATQDSNNLIINTEYTESFVHSLEALSDAGLISQDLLNTFINNVSTQGDGSSQLSLPWSTNSDATFTNGPHGDGFQPAPNTLSALDLVPSDAHVRAARDGFAQQIVCSGKTQSSWIIVNHSGGWRTSYYHVVNAQVSTTGRQVSRGEYLGDLATTQADALRCGGGWTGPHVHMALLYNGTQVSVVGLDIGGWTVGGSGTSATMTRISDGTIRYANPSRGSRIIHNDGLIGSGGSNNPPAGYTKCADEGSRCNFSGTADVVYGALNSFTSPRSFTNGVDCNNNVFGDPISGTGKSCYYKLTSGGGGLCPTLSGQVNLYDQTNCGGDYATVNGTGLWSMDSSFNDRAESIAIPVGWSVRLYQNNNENSSESACFSGTDTNLNDNTFANGGTVGNNATWLRVYDNTGCNGVPIPSVPSLNSPGNGSNNPFNYSLNFQWNSSSGATEYLVEWWGGPYNTMQPCGWSSSTSCAIGTVSAGNNYSWHVKARNSSGESAWSNTWTFTIQSQVQAPTAPSLNSPGNGSSNAYNYDLNFQWNSSSGATEYLVEWWGGPYSTMQPCGWSSSTSCHIGVIAAGNTYSWHVKARNGAGESAWSNTWVFTVQSQSLPVSAEFDTWPPSGDAPFNTTLHIVDMSNITGCLWDYGDGQTSTTCTQLHGHTYDYPGIYTVSLTVNGPGTSDYMIRTDYITVSDPSAPPNMPSNLAVTNPTAHSLTLNWQDNSNNEDGFTIYRWGYDGTNWTFLYFDSVGMDETSYTQTDLPCENDFNFYEISAYNANGESQHVGWVQGTTSTCPPLDLTINSLIAYSPYGHTNDNAYVDIAVENSTNEDISGFWIDVYVDNPPTGCGIWGDYYIWVSQLAANSTGSWTIKIPAGDLASGSHNIYAFVDSGCSVSEVDENNNFTGPASLSLVAPPAAPAHDDFDSARLISPVPYTDIVSVSGATATWDDPAVAVDACNLQPGLASVWYKYTPSSTVRLTLDTLGSDYDTYIAVWTGARGNLSPIACNDDETGGSTVQSNLQVDLTAGTTYYIEVAEYNGVLTSSSLAIAPRIKLRPGQEIQSETNTGKSASLADSKLSADIGALAGGSLNFHASAIVLSNDDFDSATLIMGVPYVMAQSTENTSVASDDPFLTMCGYLDQRYYSVWYKFTPPSTGVYVVDTFGSDYDTLLSVWRGNRGALTPVGCNDDSGGGRQSLVSVSLVSGQTYYIEIAGYSGISFGNLAVNARAAVTTSFISVGSQDGYVLESSENSNVGSGLNASSTILTLGDDAARRQYRSILSFNASSLPDTAVITAIALKVKKQGIVGGGNPVTIFKGFMADVKKGIWGTSALQASDFQAAGNASVGPLIVTSVSNWYNINLTGASAYINKLASSSGLTQIRLRFKLDDNNNSFANYLSLYSGNAPIANRPQLIITYYIP